MNYTTEGNVRGPCGHRHRSRRAAEACLERDRRGCAARGGYSDRVVVEIDSSPGRPRKGRQKRTVVLPRVEPWVADVLDAEAAEGESRADVVTRWAGEREVRAATMDEARERAKADAEALAEVCDG